MLKIIAATFSVFLLMVSCNDPQNEIEPESQEKKNQEALTAFLEKAWNEKDLDAIDIYFSENLVRQVNGVKLVSLFLAKIVDDARHKDVVVCTLQLIPGEC